MKMHILSVCAAVDEHKYFSREEKPEAILPDVMKGKVRTNKARGKADESEQQHHTETESCQETNEAHARTMHVRIR